MNEVVQYLVDLETWASFVLGFLAFALPLLLLWLGRLAAIAYRRGHLVHNKFRERLAVIIGVVIGFGVGGGLMWLTFLYRDYLRAHFAQNAAPYLLAWLVGGSLGSVVMNWVAKKGPGWHPQF